MKLSSRRKPVRITRRKTTTAVSESLSKAVIARQVDEDIKEIVGICKPASPLSPHTTPTESTPRSPFFCHYHHQHHRDNSGGGGGGGNSSQFPPFFAYLIIPVLFLMGRAMRAGFQLVFVMESGKGEGGGAGSNWIHAAQEQTQKIGGVSMMNARKSRSHKHHPPDQARSRVNGHDYQKKPPTSIRSSARDSDENPQINTMLEVNLSKTEKDRIGPKHQQEQKKAYLHTRKEEAEQKRNTFKENLYNKEKERFGSKPEEQRAKADSSKQMTENDKGNDNENGGNHWTAPEHEGPSSNEVVQQTEEKGAASLFKNHPRIQNILASDKDTWGPFFDVATKESSIKVDVTQNVPLVQDFIIQQQQLLSDQDKGSAERKTSDSAVSDSQKEHEPLNIVLFYADDWTLKVLGALNPHVKTPNIDSMGDRGMLFTHNCVTTSICWISRSTLATGVYAAIHKHVELTSTAMFNETVPWLETLYPLFRKHGYYTGLIGKWHALKKQPFINQAFDKIRSYYNKHWFIRDGKLRHVTDLNEADALEFLRNRPSGQNFFLTLSFFATHAWETQKEPYQCMNESMGLYVHDTIPRPKTATDKHWKQLPWFFDDRNMGRRRWMDRFDTNENYQHKIKNLYRMATEVDTAVGNIIAELKEQGVYEKTLLIFTTDNGNLHGEHGLAEKWYPFEESVRVPLVMEDPRMPAKLRGTRNGDLTLSVDLAPTLLSAAKIPVPSFMQGRDMADLYLNSGEASKTWRQDFFYEWNQGDPVNAAGHYALSRHVPAVFALIRKDYKYFFWPESGYEQLFHIEKDVYEEADIRNSTAQTTRQALLLMKARYRFLKRWAQAGNPV